MFRDKIYYLKKKYGGGGGVGSCMSLRITIVSHIEFIRAQFNHCIVPGQAVKQLPVLVAFTFARN
jgi:hypothetical protein